MEIRSAFGTTDHERYTVVSYQPECSLLGELVPSPNG